VLTALPAQKLGLGLSWFAAPLSIPLADGQPPLSYVGQFLALAVLLIYAILASQFRSFLRPLAFEWGAGTEWRGPMARAVIGGLITSTLLTLVVVPVVYTFLDDLGHLFARWWHRGTPEHALLNQRVPETVE
jgi:HAE1 family hydrophobic/amphiphilic exporter-1